MHLFRAKKTAGFTLVEIMIVVLIIGILLAIAIPNFIAAREASRAKACIGNLKQIDSAKQQWAMDNKVASPGTDPGVPTLVGTAAYIKSAPNCPSSGTYTPGNLATSPVCSVGSNATNSNWSHVLP